MPKIDWSVVQNADFASALFYLDVDIKIYRQAWIPENKWVVSSCAENDTAQNISLDSLYLYSPASGIKSFIVSYEELTAKDWRADYLNDQDYEALRAPPFNHNNSEKDRLHLALTGGYPCKR